MSKGNMTVGNKGSNDSNFDLNDKSGAYPARGVSQKGISPAMELDDPDDYYDSDFKVAYNYLKKIGYPYAEDVIDTLKEWNDGNVEIVRRNKFMSNELKKFIEKAP